MLGLVSNTDRRWFEHLRDAARSAGGRLDEVNFWRPRSQRALRSVEPGAPFFLRLKSPVNAIAGFGFFAHWQLVPFLEAWNLFGPKNGAPTLDAFRRQITSLRESDPMLPGARPVGCVILRDAVFLDERDWLPWDAAQGWSRHVVNDKTYELTAAPGQQLLALIRGRYDRRLDPTHVEPERPADLADGFQLVPCDTRHWRDQVLPVREAQGTFRLRLLDAYGRRCAVTGERVEPVLEAAHIQPYLGAASNHVQNGLLLRSDLHKLYDRGLVAVTPDLRFRVSDRIQEEWHNGREYYALRDRPIGKPRDASRAPSRDALAWHEEFVFR